MIRTWGLALSTSGVFSRREHFSRSPCGRVGDLNFPPPPQRTLLAALDPAYASSAVMRPAPRSSNERLAIQRAGYVASFFGRVTTRRVQSRQCSFVMTSIMSLIKGGTSTMAHQAAALTKISSKSKSIKWKTPIGLFSFGSSRVWRWHFSLI